MSLNLVRILNEKGVTLQARVYEKGELMYAHVVFGDGTGNAANVEVGGVFKSLPLSLRLDLPDSLPSSVPSFVLNLSTCIASLIVDVNAKMVESMDLELRIGSTNLGTFTEGFDIHTTLGSINIDELLKSIDAQWTTAKNARVVSLKSFLTQNNIDMNIKAVSMFGLDAWSGRTCTAPFKVSIDFVASDTRKPLVYGRRNANWRFDLTYEIQEEKSSFYEIEDLADDLTAYVTDRIEHFIGIVSEPSTVLIANDKILDIMNVKIRMPTRHQIINMLRNPN